MQISHAGLSRTGLIRKRNEDSWYADLASGVFIVADGMGGHRAGDVASGLVVEYLPQILARYSLPSETGLYQDNIEQLKSAMNELNQLIFLQGAAQPGQSGMGATAVILLVSNHRAMVGHMGDSRMYLQRDKKLVQVTHDHSVTQHLIDHGEISEEEAVSHESKGRISQYLGMKAEPFPDILLLTLKKHDRMLLCSDGLNGMVGDQQINELLSGHADPEDACTALVKAAENAGGIDNITTLIVDVLN